MIKIYGRLAIIALLVFAGVSLWYGRVEKRLQTKNPIAKNEAAIPPVQKAAESETVKTDYQIILTRNIFKAALEGDGQPSGEQQPAEAEDLAETKMQLVLLGTVAGSKEDARAVIRNEKTKVEDIYHVGSELYGGASITRIGRGKVVLQVNGREEVLNIKETESRGGATTSGFACRYFATTGTVRWGGRTTGSGGRATTAYQFSQFDPLCPSTRCPSTGGHGACGHRRVFLRRRTGKTGGRPTCSCCP